MEIWELTLGQRNNVLCSESMTYSVVVNCIHLSSYMKQFVTDKYRLQFLNSEESSCKKFVNPRDRCTEKHF
jgi:hypothetical protein